MTVVMRVEFGEANMSAVMRVNTGDAWSAGRMSCIRSRRRKRRGCMRCRCHRSR